MRLVARRPKVFLSAYVYIVEISLKLRNYLENRTSSQFYFYVSLLIRVSLSLAGSHERKSADIHPLTIREANCKVRVSS